MNSHNPIFCAFDTPDLAHAKQLAASLKSHIGGIKLGLEFFTAQGAEGVRQVAALGVPVFLDLKFHDIPNTVAHVVKVAVQLDIYMMTIHTSGGQVMMQAAAEAAAQEAARLGKRKPLIIGVTVLTSMQQSDLQPLGITATVDDQVLRLAKLARESGLDGVVCSPHEIAALRAACGEDFTLVVPGIRPAGSDHGDQKRVMTPQEAVRKGASYIVIGRPITQAENPALAAEQIAASLGS
jgi:orotidine-5'-phosphate decarboxylase